jgi:hypothetical protein
MDMLQWIQELPAAQVIVGLLVLPWIGVALMQAFSVGLRAGLDDAWQFRADAALRWADADAVMTASTAPMQAPAVSVLQPRPRRTAQATSWAREMPELHAA